MKVDILIPSKDRPAQLHQLLLLIGCNVDGIGQITITIQASNLKYKKGYEILQQRLNGDECFRLLRGKSKIVIMYRDKLSKISEALNDLGDSKLLLILTDDEIFFGEIDFKSNRAIEIFLNDQEILACSIRLGLNITPKVPKTHSHFIKAQPNFIKQSDEYLIWSWPDNLNTYHWACIFSTSGHIYRKSDYLEWFDALGRDNFLKIEGHAVKYSVSKFFTVHIYLLSIVEFIDFFLERVFKKFTKINYQPIVFNFFVKYVFLSKIFTTKGAKLKMISLSQSVTAAIDINTSQQWRGEMSNFIDNSLINEKYLDGYVISNEITTTLDFNEPNLRGREVKLEFVKYTTGFAHDSLSTNKKSI